MKSILFVGFATMDIFQDCIVPGGAAASMALNATSLKIKSFLSAPLGMDTYGQKYQQILNKFAIDTSLCFKVPQRHSQLERRCGKPNYCI